MGMVQNKSCASFVGFATPADVFDPYTSSPRVGAFVHGGNSLQAIARVLRRGGFGRING